MLVPNTYRVIIKPIRLEGLESGIVLPSETMKKMAGENLFYGEIIHPGDTIFEKGQHVFFSEYSTAAVKDFGNLSEGESMPADAEEYLIVAQDDIMAYYDDSEEISTTTKKD